MAQWTGVLGCDGHRPIVFCDCAETQ